MSTDELISRLEQTKLVAIVNPHDRETSLELIEILVELRKNARKQKDFATSDSIRDKLAAIGVILEDGQSGTTWKTGLSDLSE